MIEFDPPPPEMNFCRQFCVQKCVSFDIFLSRTGQFSKINEPFEAKLLQKTSSLNLVISIQNHNNRLQIVISRRISLKKTRLLIILSFDLNQIKSPFPTLLRHCNTIQRPNAIEVR